MNTLMLTILGGLLVAVIYGFTVGGREEEIRKRLTSRFANWWKKRYAKAMIEAVSGRYYQLVVSQVTLTPIILLFGIVFLTGHQVGQVTYQVEQARALVASAQENEAELLLMLVADSTDIQRRPEQLLKDIRATIQDAHDYERSAIWMSRLYILLSIVVSVAVAWMALVWRPIFIFRSRFARELERLSLRMDHLASRAEIAGLAAARARVADEESLRMFVSTLKRITTNNGLPDPMVDLWLTWCEEFAS